MCMCMCIYIYTIYIYIYIYIYYIYIYVCVCVCVYISIYIYIYMWCVYMSIYIYIYIERERERERDRDREIERERANKSVTVWTFIEQMKRLYWMQPDLLQVFIPMSGWYSLCNASTCLFLLDCFATGEGGGTDNIKLTWFPLLKWTLAFLCSAHISLLLWLNWCLKHVFTTDYI